LISLAFCFLADGISSTSSTANMTLLCLLSEHSLPSLFAFSQSLLLFHASGIPSNREGPQNYTHLQKVSPSNYSLTYNVNCSTINQFPRCHGLHFVYGASLVLPASMFDVVLLVGQKCSPGNTSALWPKYSCESTLAR
jgi:hypothetical protein